MFKFIEIEQVNEVVTGVVDRLIKIVTISEDAYLVTARQYDNREGIHILKDALIWSEQEVSFIYESLSIELQSEMCAYVEKALKEEPQEKTTGQVQREFIEYLWNMIDYWENNPDRKTTKEKMSGLVFTILAALYGCDALPGFIVAPCPHENDKEYFIEQGENYYPYNDTSIVKGDIAGNLHEVFYPLGRSLGYFDDSK